eukprot:gene915-1112_t
MDGATRQDQVFMAQVCERSERWEEMKKWCALLATNPSGLTTDERNLFSIAFKNVLAHRRASRRAMIEMSKNNVHDPAATGMIKRYMARIEGEIEGLCHECINLITGKNAQNLTFKGLLPTSTTDEDKVFYHKMLGDYHRYLAEIGGGQQDANKVRESAHNEYKQASDIALSSLNATHPI